jgi:bifunctional polynucleotide phosphatase/kinase
LSKDPRDWKFNLPCVPKKITELFEEKDNDNPEVKSIFVIFSNQLNLNSKVAERASFETKIDSVISKLSVSNKCPVICLFATARDEFRKPCKGMWSILKEEFLDKFECKIQMEDSFFVGDAAGRFASWKPGRSADWSSVDHKFAINVGLKFYTPEEFFLNESTINTFDLGRDPKTLVISNCKNFDIDNLFDNSNNLMVMAVGSPASGKSTFYHQYLKSMNFVHINRDILKTIPKCLKLARSALESKQSVYIDNTHPTRESREAFVSMAKEFNVSVKCLHFISDEWLCKHLDIYRSITKNVEPLPSVAFNSFRAKYQQPIEIEGFDAIIQVPFIANFESSDEIDLFQSYLF